MDLKQLATLVSFAAGMTAVSLLTDRRRKPKSTLTPSLLDDFWGMGTTKCLCCGRAIAYPIRGGEVGLVPTLCSSCQRAA